jgi:uridine kinase
MKITSPTRLQVIEELAEMICEIDKPHPVRVAVDGVDGAGKTTLAETLVVPLEGCGRSVIRASIDGFHNPQSVRYKQGADSPEGYYRDSFNHQAILDALLLPLGPGGSRRYRQAVYDYRVEVCVYPPQHIAPLNAVLLFDGVFLLRPELRAFWDFSIFVKIDFKISVARAAYRDKLTSGNRRTLADIRRKYEIRYVPGQRIYFREAAPQKQAAVILDNNDLENPILIHN